MSGAKVVLVANDKKELLVEKFYKKPNNKLKEQAEKLNLLNSINMNVPKTLDFNDKKLYLEYVPGETVANIFQTCDLSRIEIILDKILSDLNKLKQRSHRRDITFQKFINLRIEKIKQNNYLKEKYYNFLNKILDNLSYYDFEETMCHGDFALDNMIINTKNEIFYLDPLKVSPESYIVDISKLYFDLFFYWPQRKSKIKNNLQFRINLDYSLNYVTNYIKKNEKFKSHDFFLFLSFISLIRVLPYCSKTVEFNLIDEGIKRILKNV